MDAGAMAAARRWNDALKKLSNTSRRRRASQTAAFGARRGGLEANRPEEDEPRDREQCASALGKRFAIPFSQQTDIQL
jgi:hypothetical protein